MARLAAMSQSAFSDRFLSLVDESPKAYLSRLRLARAARLLRTQAGIRLPRESMSR